MRAVLAFVAGATVALAQVPSGPLLSTDDVSAKVKELQTQLEDHSKASARPRNYARLKDLVRDFVIHQLDAAPAISAEDLREQLRKIVGRGWSEDIPTAPPYARSGSGWGPRSVSRTWAIAYSVWLGVHGVGGVGVVIDSYVWENGKTRIAGRGGGELSGHGLTGEWLSSGPDRLILLAHGNLSGSNGKIMARAALYMCDSAGVHTLWQTPLVASLTAMARDNLFVLRYLESARYSDDPEVSTLDVYEVGYTPSGPPPVILVDRRLYQRH